MCDCQMKVDQEKESLINPDAYIKASEDLNLLKEGFRNATKRDMLKIRLSKHLLKAKIEEEL